MWRNRRQRAAISQAEIAKKCNLLGCFAAGYRAYRGAANGDTFPCPYPMGSEEGKAWMEGCNFAAEKASE